MHDSEHGTRNRAKPDFERFIAAFAEFQKAGGSTIMGEDCATVIAFEKGEFEVWTVRCQCGKYNETLRGL